MTARRWSAFATPWFIVVAGCASSTASPVAAPRAVGYTVPLAPEARTQIVVLGTAHLGEVEDCLGPQALDAVVERLRAWRPDVIAIESLPARTVEALAVRDDEFAVLIREDFARRTLDAGRMAQEALQLQPTAARQAIATLVEQQPLTAVQRVRLVLLFAAAHELASAVLHWSYLADDERAQAVVPGELRSLLETRRTAANEVARIALPLARSLSLARLALVDDFDGEEAYAARVEQFVKERAGSAELAALKNAPLYAESTARLRAGCREPQQMLAFYRWLNDPAYSKADVSLQWGVWFRTKFPSGLDRARYAGWEARNLGIAAKIRKESSMFPGKRVLVIYGSGHKPFLDAYLSQMLDVKLVDSADVLGVPTAQR